MRSPTATLLLIPLIVFAGFLLIGIPLAVLPIYVHRTLGLDSFWVGITIGAQSLATLATRPYAGRFNDLSKTGRSVRLGLAIGLGASALYLLSLLFAAQPIFSLGILLAGRFVLGLAESMLLVGSHSWGIALLGSANAGKVISWNGIAMFAAIALGAPLGATLMASGGFLLVAQTTLVLPLLAFGLTYLLRSAAPTHGERLPFSRVVGRVWQPGVTLFLGSVGFSVITVFITLYYAHEHWLGAAYTLTAFGLANILVRLLLAGCIDRFGGSVVAALSLVVEVIGLGTLGLAPGPAMALLGAALSGAGFSLVFPALGVLAVQSLPPQNRGSAVGAYAAFFDLALAVVAPLAGWLIEVSSYRCAYLLAAAAAALAAVLAFSAYRSSRPPAATP